MKIIKSRGHGKACRGRKRTATYQVVEDAPTGYYIREQFRFTVGDDVSQRRAFEKAKAFVRAKEEQ